MASARRPAQLTARERPDGWTSLGVRAVHVGPTLSWGCRRILVRLCGAAARRWPPCRGPPSDVDPIGPDRRAAL